jgi:peroxiredoxin
MGLDTRLAERLIPGQPVPPLGFLRGDGTRGATDALGPAALSLIAVYRGGWCADCRRFITALDAAAPELRAIGIECVALSVDDAEAAALTARDWDIVHLALGSGLDVEAARGWGLYASRMTMHGAERFCVEPGLFLLRPDHSLYALWIQSLPSARPQVSWLVETLTYLANAGFPLRGAD